ncbi:NINE protein [Clostridium sp.]|uniref:NINE protein n=1 Tax=Clostridium sp. TaxID=1506 RepID=UPI002613D4F9|nr:NINE protein [Clostridium sp.]
MYCRECGEEYSSDKAVICVKCGVERNKGNNYCPECGKVISNHQAEVCLNCGISLKRVQVNNVVNNTSSKTKMAAALFAFFLGGLGIHRFYLGYTGVGITFVVLFVLGFLTFGITWFITGIWALIEFILILCNVIKDSNGNQLI